MDFMITFLDKIGIILIGWIGWDGLDGWDSKNWSLRSVVTWIRYLLLVGKGEPSPTS